MRPISSPRMHVVRKEEKEARLSAFIDAQLGALSADGSHHLTVLARSADSPVLKALAGRASVIGARIADVRIIIVQPDVPASAEVALFMAGVTCRTGCDSRLLDAHEQLAIGDQIAWIGDCMRREPTKRDAYECYSSDCRETAAYAHRSFERVWGYARTGKPAVNPAVAPAAKPQTPVELAAAALTESEAAPLVSTRH